MVTGNNECTKEVPWRRINVESPRSGLGVQWNAEPKKLPVPRRRGRRSLVWGHFRVGPRVALEGSTGWGHPLHHAPDRHYPPHSTDLNGQPLEWYLVPKQNLHIGVDCFSCYWRTSTIQSKASVIRHDKKVFPAIILRTTPSPSKLTDPGVAFLPPTILAFDFRKVRSWGLL